MTFIMFSLKYFPTLIIQFCKQVIINIVFSGSSPTFTRVVNP